MKSGTLSLSPAGGWKHTALAALLSALLSGGAVYWTVRCLPLDALPLSIVSALLAYVLLRVFYPAFDHLLPGGKREESVDWVVSASALTLAGKSIDRSGIRAVHCWPNRDALGNDKPGWTVNIETDGKNILLRSLTGEDRAEQSAQALQSLVEALGYGGAWHRP
ncbi:hypothetical protein KQI82_02600 [Oscillibacter sp. MSJ-2]|uniref:Uncharacterized protein n=1 Tax=Dysosmobacter acutus TaxID=2841504 RepID=A0ABS6F8Y9_9FIRM|nr:hypothetical protein [Dysosmobacter acutus]MBU5625825.1 hypothetical protein [Dysosmobacter acutus]